MIDCGATYCLEMSNELSGSSHFVCALVARTTLVAWTAPRPSMLTSQPSELCSTLCAGAQEKKSHLEDFELIALRMRAVARRCGWQDPAGMRATDRASFTRDTCR